MVLLLENYDVDYLKGISKASTSVNLKDGMILMLDNGTGEYSVDSGPVIN